MNESERREENTARKYMYYSNNIIQLGGKQFLRKFARLLKNGLSLANISNNDYIEGVGYFATQILLVQSMCTWLLGVAISLLSIRVEQN